MPRGSFAIPNLVVFTSLLLFFLGSASLKAEDLEFDATLFDCADCDACVSQNPCCCVPSLEPSGSLLGTLGFERRLERLFGASERRLHLPLGVGAYHWWIADASGRGNNGYGAKGLRGTYFYYVTASPEVDLGGGHKVGGYVDMRFRDGQPWRA